MQFFRKTLYVQLKRIQQALVIVKAVDDILAVLPQSQRQFQDGRPGMISSALLSTTNMPKRSPVKSFILLISTYTPTKKS